MSYWSGSRPAKTAFSKSPITASICASVGLSVSANDTTPLLYFHLFEIESIRAAVRSASPRSTSGGGSRWVNWPGIRAPEVANFGTTTAVQY